MRIATPACRPGQIILLLSCLTGGPAPGQEPTRAPRSPEGPGRANLVPAAAVVPVAAPRRRALLVGISGYTKLGGRTGDWPDLPTRSDVEVMRQVLVGRYGFDPEQVKVLTEGEAERQMIVDRFRSHLIEDARPGDIVIFYFSGHGQRIPDPKSWGGLRGSLVTADYIDGDARKGAQTHLRSDTLRDLLRELKAKMRKDPADPDSPVEGNITVLLDACYSGGGTKGLLKPKGRAWDPAKDGPIPGPEPGVRSKGAAGFFDKDEAVAQGYVLLAASRSEQPALAPVEGTEISLMTYHLAELLAKAPPSTTYRDAFRRLEVALAGNQSPQLEGRSDQRLFATEERPAEETLPVLKVEGGRVTLPMGRVQGATKGSRFALFPAGVDIKDPRNKVAEVEVEAVRSTTCVAAPTAEYAAVDPKSLAEARAVEVLHNYGEHPLRVLFARGEPPDRLETVGPPAGLLRGAGDVLTTEGVSPGAAYDLRARREGGAWVLERPSRDAHEAPGDPAPAGATTAPPATPAGGLVLARIKDDADAALHLREALEGEWRYQFLARTLKRVDPANALNIEVKVVPWLVQENDDGEKVDAGPRDSKEAEGQVALRPGDFVAVFVRNSGTEPVYVTALDLGTNGSIQPLFPPKGSPPIEHYGPARLMPGQGWERLRGQVVQLEKPAGQELIKVIATKQPADFGRLLYIPPGNKAMSEAFEGVPSNLRPLGRLLDSLRQGTKAPLSTTLDWCTAECIVEVQSP